MHVLGVDPGSRVCGYGVLSIADRRKPVYLECGVLTSKQGTAEARLADIARGLAEIIAEFRPVAVAVEDVFVHQNPRSALLLSQARGVVLAVAGLAALPVFSYAPAVVKRAVTGRGRAPKEQVSKMVQVLIGLRSPPRADAADALAVALAHVHHLEAS